MNDDREEGNENEWKGEMRVFAVLSEGQGLSMGIDRSIGFSEIFSSSLGRMGFFGFLIGFF